MKTCYEDSETPETVCTIFGILLAILDISLQEDDKYSINSIVKIFLIPAACYSATKITKLGLRIYDECINNHLTDNNEENIEIIGEV